MVSKVLQAPPFSKVPYAIQGGLGAALPMILPEVSLEVLTQEFGTYPALRILHALREENRWHNLGENTLQHPSRHRLLQMFCLSTPTWRSAVLK
jgi:hypothetical protein